MKKSLIPASILLTSSIFLTACSSDPSPDRKPNFEASKEQESQQTAENTNQVAKKEQQTISVDKVKEHMNTQDVKIKELTEEVTYYKQYVNDVTLTLTPDKLEELINKEWKYSMTVNHVQFPKDGVLEITQPDFELILKEERVKFSVLPEEESAKGKIASSLEESLQILELSEKSTVITKSEGLTSSTVLSFKDLSPSDVVKITLQDSLVEKLNMVTSEIEIRVVN